MLNTHQFTAFKNGNTSPDPYLTIPVDHEGTCCTPAWHPLCTLNTQLIGEIIPRAAGPPRHCSSDLVWLLNSFGQARHPLWKPSTHPWTPHQESSVSLRPQLYCKNPVRLTGNFKIPLYFNICLETYMQHYYFFFSLFLFTPTD